MKENEIENILDNEPIRPSLFDPNAEPEEKDEWEKKSCCSKCCFYTFCCCCCVKYEKNTNYYLKGWRKYLKKEGKESSDLSFQILTNLFANADNAINSLENIRLNPNLVSEKKLRNDLEFYIPQLCTFLLFGEVKAVEEFFVFLCRVCSASFFFAHRVHWFLSAMINNAQDKREDIENMLKLISTVFKSEDKKKKNKIEKLYITNSESYVKYIDNNDLYFLYDNKFTEENINIFEKIDFNSLNMEQQLIYNKYKESRDIIKKFSEDEYKTVRDKQVKKLKDSGKLKNVNIDLIKNANENIINDINTGNEGKKQFKPNDFFIDISNFKLNNKDITMEDDDDLYVVDGGEVKNEKDKQDFLYNNNKINDFEIVNKTQKDINFISYHSTLNFIDHLCDISNDLPKFPIDEQMLFLYKKLNEINKKLPCNVYLPFLKDSARNYLVVHIPLDGVKIFRTKTRCPIMLTFEMVRINEINKEIQKEEEREDKFGKFASKSIAPSELSSNLNLSLEEGFKKKKSKKKLLENIITSDEDNYDNCDYDLSRPLLINEEIDKKIIKDIKVENKKEKEKEKDDSEKYKVLANKFKTRNTVFRNLNQSKTVFERKGLSLGEKPLISTNEKPKKKSIEDKYASKLETIGEMMEPQADESSIIDEKEIKTKKKSMNYEDFSNIFGETFEEKENNLKKTSLFGDFKSHKIFRCIFKTHEDLRQEQFATQLINEFNQIFKLEHVDCWLNTYEIISTGNDAGLVEMVNNSLSLDQLKQKLNNIPLRDFYLYYWGKGHSNSPEYKKAMNNYVSSLAGYSLICYFLQIRDRHNGNILIDNEGHLTHIDFGFLLSNAPGKGLKFENAPFKLSKDMLECLGGTHGSYFDKFRKLLKQGFLAVFKHRKKILILVEMMWCGNGRNLDCFEKGQEAIDELKLRLQPKGCTMKKDALQYVDKLIELSVDNWRTKWYDIFQYYVQGIFY